MIPFLSRKPLLILAIFAAGALPPLGYYLAVGRAPGVSVREAVRMLSEAHSADFLVDVRERGEFDANHLDGAVNWPYEEIRNPPAGQGAAAIPEQFRGKTILLICQSGIQSARAAMLLRETGLVQAISVRGGMANWVAGAPEPPAGAGFFRMRNAAGDTTGLPFRESSRTEQWAALAMFWAIKPLYVVLSVILVGFLWRAKSPDLAALRWGLAFFFAGEAFCYANFFLCRSGSPLLEYLHSFGMVLSFAFAAFALFEGMDRRLIRYSAPSERCAALGLCRACPKYTDAPCGLKRLFLFLTPACIVLCFIPLAAVPYSVSYNTRVMWVFLNYSNPVLYQLFEIRCCPFFAIGLFAAAFAVLLFKKHDPVSPAKVIFSAGAGFLGFSLFRLFLSSPYRDNIVWFTFWEEVTELIYVCGAAYVLWLFRASLLGAGKGRIQ